MIINTTRPGLMRRPWRAVSCMFLCLGLVQCEAQPGGEAVLESDNRAIMNGDTVTQNSYGVVAVYHGFTRPCSGSYLGNEWVLTARHCVQVETYAEPPAPGSELLPPSAFLVTSALSPGAPTPNPASLPPGKYATVAKVVEFAPTVDLAMLKLNAPLTTPPAKRSSTSSAGHVGSRLRCQGYGRYTNVRAPNTAEDETTTGAGTLRQALLDVTGMFYNDYEGRLDNGWEIEMERNSRDQALISGDSGGPCFDTNVSGAYQASVNRGVVWRQNGDVQELASAYSVSVARDTPWSAWIDWTRLDGWGPAQRQFLLD